MLDRTTENNYRHSFEMIDGRKQWYLEATCSRCNITGQVKLNRKSTLSQAYADQNFQKEGWRIDSGRSKDVCPTCIEGEKVLRKTRNEMAAPEIRDEPDEEQKFIIEYIGEKLRTATDTGERFYKHPWSDGAVLRELVNLFPDLTLTKVEQIRAKHFGKITTTPIAKPARDIDKLFDHLAHENEALKALVSNLSQKIDRLTNQQSQAMHVVKDRLEEFQTSLEEIEDEQDMLKARFEAGVNRSVDVRSEVESDKAMLKAKRQTANA